MRVVGRAPRPIAATRRPGAAGDPSPRWPAGPRGVGLPAIGLLALAVLTVSCGGPDEEGRAVEEDVSDGWPLVTAPEPPPVPGPADALVSAANEAMAAAGFRARGAAVGFEGGEQEMRVAAEGTVHITVTAPELPEPGEMFCRDGVMYTSVPLHTARLRQAGDAVTVPGDLANHFVSSPVGGDCRVLWEIPARAVPAPERDLADASPPTRAFVVPDETGEPLEIHHMAAEGEPLLLRVERPADTDSGVAGDTEFLDHGKGGSPRVPDDSTVVSAEEFRNLLEAG
ncbi:hypothetical protein [Streptomyces sp. ST2-7A]|uniref:hypothetical protein n=1 Tax=Streptomyces sp. ST2-7A TaxID=2907214 RepID=UPI001F234947|nr:hypothetical protein [Streptomyces sp. ST2-7A]MCE7080026.1 hypothetical protein [Streptomyces sp. ST2-7A]